MLNLSPCLVKHYFVTSISLKYRSLIRCQIGKKEEIVNLLRTGLGEGIALTENQHRTSKSHGDGEYYYGGDAGNFCTLIYLILDSPNNVSIDGIKDIDFEMNQITVRSGKGNKDRITMLPEKLKESL